MPPEGSWIPQCDRVIPWREGGGGSRLNDKSCHGSLAPTHKHAPARTNTHSHMRDGEHTCRREDAHTYTTRKDHTQEKINNLLSNNIYLSDREKWEGEVEKRRVTMVTHLYLSLCGSWPVRPIQSSPRWWPPVRGRERGGLQFEGHISCP